MPLVSQAPTEILHAAAASRRGLRLELDGHLCRARIHRSLAGQLIGNLLDNACKHTSPGIPITVRLIPGAETVRLKVEDRGEGISVSELPLIFEPFYRSPEARRRGLPGAGFGLAIAKRIALALGGQLRVESQLGRGSRFELLLPRCDLRLRQQFTTVAHGRRKEPGC